MKAHRLTCATRFFFYSYVGIHQVRILVFDNYYQKVSTAFELQHRAWGLFGPHLVREAALFLIYQHPNNFRFTIVPSCSDYYLTRTHALQLFWNVRGSIKKKHFKQTLLSFSLFFSSKTSETVSLLTSDSVQENWPLIIKSNNILEPYGPNCWQWVTPQ